MPTWWTPSFTNPSWWQATCIVKMVKIFQLQQKMENRPLCWDQTSRHHLVFFEKIRRSEKQSFQVFGGHTYWLPYSVMNYFQEIFWWQLSNWSFVWCKRTRENLSQNEWTEVNKLEHKIRTPSDTRQKCPHFGKLQFWIFVSCPWHFKSPSQ